MKGDAAFNRRVLRAFEDLLDEPPATWADRLDTNCPDEPAVRDAVRAMIDAHRSGDLLPTLPPAPRVVREEGPAPSRVGQYRVLSELGRGGMGVVYLAERADGLFDHRVAIKLIRQTSLSERARTKFATERQVLARLRHPHIAQMHDGGTTEGGAPYMVMECIAGAPITDHCEAKRVDLRGRIALFRQACAAIEFAHRNLVVHADIKPTNVVVEEGFGVKLLDFGVARLLDDLVEAGDGGYTQGYASPARIAGSPATPADDVYGAGALLRELIAHQPGVDPDLLAIVVKATADREERRYGAISELVGDLDRWAANRPVEAAPAGRRRRALLFWRRHRLGLGILAVAGLAVSAALAVFASLYLQSERHRLLAEQRYASTQHMADYIISDVDPALARVSGTLALRKRLLERTDRYLKGLETNRSASAALKREIAAGYLRMAKIYGLDPSGGLGDLATAEKDLAHAEVLIDEAAHQESQAPQLLALRGQAKMLAGTEVFPAPSRATAEASLAELHQAKGFLGRYLRLKPGDADAQLSLWETTVIQQRDYLYLGRPLTAIADLQRYLRQSTPPVRTYAQQEQRSFLINASYLVLGESYQDSDLTLSLRYFTTLIDRVSLLRKRSGVDWESGFTQASGYVGRGRIESKMMNLKSAAMDYTRAIGLMQDLLHTDDNHGIEWQLSYTRSLLANVDSKLGKYTTASRLSDLGILWLRKDLASAPHDVARLRRLAVGLSTRAEIEQRGTNDVRVCAMGREAVDVWTKLNQLHATTPMDLMPDGAEAQATAVVGATCRLRASTSTVG